MMLTSTQKAAFQKHLKNAKQSHWPCIAANCYANSINSHIVQKNRYLNVLANFQNKVYVNEPDLFSKTGTSTKSKGINEVLAFPCFCARHDNRIFKEIENKGGIDFNNWRHLHLLCYRTKVSERRKKDIIAKAVESYLTDTSIFKSPDNQNRNSIKEVDKLSIKDSNKTVFDINTDLNSNIQRNFIHSTPKKINHTGVCIAGVFSLETTHDLHMRIAITGKVHDYLSSVFIHLIPLNKNEDVVFVSYETSRDANVRSYLSAIFTGTEKELLKQLSDLMFLQVENWACSFDFYEKNISWRENEIENLISRNANVLDETKSLHFNIFET